LLHTVVAVPVQSGVVYAFIVKVVVLLVTISEPLAVCAHTFSW
jgi:hypothetical protein